MIAPGLLVRPMKDRNATISSLRQTDTPSTPIEDAEPILLKPGEPDEVVRKQVARISGSRVGTTYVADFVTENPGPLQEYSMLVQLFYENSDKERTYLPPTILVYRPSTLRSVTRSNNTSGSSVVPDIPGFDGKPLDMPRVVEHPAGGFQRRRKQRVATGQPPRQPNRFRNLKQPVSTD